MRDCKALLHLPSLSRASAVSPCYASLRFVLPPPPQIRSFKLIEARLVSGRTAGKPAFAVPLYFLLALLPVVVPIALVCVSVAGLAALAKVFMFMSERKSLGDGFGLLGGVLYR
jgi:hypothetical protein